MACLRTGRARVTSQLSIAARTGDINWDDLACKRSYDGMKAYRQSKTALGLFALELEHRVQAGGWGITSNISHSVDDAHRLWQMLDELTGIHDWPTTSTSS